MLRPAEQILHDVLLERYNQVRDADEFEEGRLNELDELSDFVSTADTRTLCILSVSFLEDTLRRNFIRHWSIEGTSALDAHFGSNGPLSTFSQRTLVATAVGWIPSQLAGEARTLRKIRNAFAHNHKVHVLSEPPLLDLAQSMRASEETWNEIPHYQVALEGSDLERKLRLRVFFHAMMLVTHILTRSKLMLHGLTWLRRDGKLESQTGVEKRTAEILIRHCFRELGLDWSAELTP